MDSKQRQQLIVETVNKLGTVSVKKLSNRFEVSEVTIRRDLEKLDKKGALKRAFGGAVRISSVIDNPSLKVREQLYIKEKKAISLAALPFVRDNMSVYIDNGTTTKLFASYLNEFKNLTVFTTDLLISYNLSEFKNIEINLIGGTLDKSTLSTSSTASLLRISDLYFDLSVMGCDAFDRYAVYSSSDIRASIKRRVVQNSKKSVLLADSSKFNFKKNYKVSDNSRFYSIISDTRYVSRPELIGNKNVILTE